MDAKLLIHRAFGINGDDNLSRKNSENPKVGAVFQTKVAEWFRRHYSTEFVLEKKIPIGDPAKDHRFDIVSADETMAIECKCYTWTETGNVPSAKMGFTNEAAFYLSFLPDSYEKYIVMAYSWHNKREKTLAEYYHETYRHLLHNIIVAEFNSDTDEFRVIK